MGHPVISRNGVVVQERQTIFDIAIQEYGTPEACFQLMDDNADVITHLTMELEAGTVLKIKSPVVNKAVADYYAEKKLQPISGNKSAPDPATTNYKLRSQGGRRLRSIGSALTDDSTNFKLRSDA